jgi:hypothetical protein
VLAVDLASAVDERVDQRESDRVRFGAGADLAGDRVLGFGEVGVGAPPQRARVLVEAELSRWALQGATGDPLAEQIHAALTNHPAGLTRSQISDTLQHERKKSLACSSVLPFCCGSVAGRGGLGLGGGACVRSR